MKNYLVSAIVSTYNSERFMRGLLEDLERQTIASDMEIVVVDSASPQNEGAIVQEFARRYDNIQYLRTDQREGLYVAWNRAIGMARGKYFTNANTDDRHSADCFEKLAARLESDKQIALAYADQLISTVENETFDACVARSAQVKRWPEYTPADLMLRCMVGTQPMWRAAAHEEHGPFSTRYPIAGDYEYWMRIAQTGQLSHVAESLGVNFGAPTTLFTANAWQCEIESLEIRRTYLPRDPWRSDPGLPARLGHELFGIGYRYIQRRERSQAMPFLKEAWRLDRFNLNFAKTLLLRGWLGIESGVD